MEIEELEKQIQLAREERDRMEIEYSTIKKKYLSASSKIGALTSKIKRVANYVIYDEKLDEMAQKLREFNGKDIKAIVKYNHREKLSRGLFITGCVENGIPSRVIAKYLGLKERTTPLHTYYRFKEECIISWEFSSALREFRELLKKEDGKETRIKNSKEALEKQERAKYEELKKKYG